MGDVVVASWGGSRRADMINLLKNDYALMETGGVILHLEENTGSSTTLVCPTITFRSLCPVQARKLKGNDKKQLEYNRTQGIQTL